PWSRPWSEFHQRRPFRKIEAIFDIGDDHKVRDGHAILGRHLIAFLPTCTSLMTAPISVRLAQSKCSRFLRCREGRLLAHCVDPGIDRQGAIEERIQPMDQQIGEIVQRVCRSLAFSLDGYLVASLLHLAWLASRQKYPFPWGNTAATAHLYFHWSPA